MEQDNDLIKVLDDTFQSAYRLKHEFITTEHFLYAVLLNDKGKDILNYCGVNCNEAMAKLTVILNELDKVPYNRGYEPTESEIFDILCENAEKKAKEYGKETLSVSIMIMCLMYCGTMAAYILDDSGFDMEKLEEFIEDESGITFVKEPLKQKEKDYLLKFAVDLTEKAENGLLDPVIGRKDVINKTVCVLARRRKNNPLHVGEAGVGKTTIIEGIAQLIVSDESPKELAGSKLFSLDMSTMIAGTSHRGEFEDKLIRVLEFIKRYNKPIVYIDEIHTIVGAGSAGAEDGASDAASIIKKYLLEDKIKFIGSTTNDEYRKIFEKKKALARRFAKIDISEPSLEDCIAILEGIKNTYEEYHKVKYTKEALDAAVKLSERYITDRKLPDKAIDLIDEAAAFVKTNDPDWGESEIVIDTDLIEKIVSQTAKVKVESVNSDETVVLRDLEENIKKEVFGQENAVTAVTDVVKTARAGINDRERPLANMLFVGPTGVGKTELAKTLSSQLSVPLVRFDMSEYQEEFTLSKLIGSAPGYVGYEEGGLLAEQIRNNPNCVLLLDEIEKAHRKIYNLLLQIMDYGTMTDNMGRKINFRNVILIMTSNAGASRMNKKSIGFNEKTMKNDAVKNELEKTFTPEFRNRLDDIIIFNNITPEIALSIVKKAVSKISDRLADKNVKISITDEAGQWLAKKGYSELYGAREINRVVESKIKKPIVNEILFGKIKNGGSVSIDIKNDELKFSFRKKAK